MMSSVFAQLRKMYQKKNSNAQKQRLKRELKFKKYLTNFIWITVNQL